MAKKLALIFAFACLSAASASAVEPTRERTNVIALSNDFGDRYNFRQLTYERAWGRQSCLIGLSGGLLVDGSDENNFGDYSAVGGVAAYRWWLGPRPTLMGWFVGPALRYGVKSLSGNSNGPAIGTRSTFLSAALEGGYQKIFKNGFTLGVGTEVNRWEGSSSFGIGLTLGLGYAY